MDRELEDLGRAVKQAQYRQFRALELAFAPLGTTVVQWDALRAIGAAPGASAHALALATFQTDQAFGTLANRLEAQALVSRTPGAGRRIEHRLTAKGEKLLVAGNDVAERVRANLYAGITAADRHALQTILDRFLAGDEAVMPIAKAKSRPKAAPQSRRAG